MALLLVPVSAQRFGCSNPVRWPLSSTNEPSLNLCQTGLPVLAYRCFEKAGTQADERLRRAPLYGPARDQTKGKQGSW